MKFRTLTAAAIIAIAASSANAGNPGGLLNEMVEREVEEQDEFLIAPAPSGSGSDSKWMLLGLIALLAAIAAGGSGGGT